MKGCLPLHASPATVVSANDHLGDLEAIRPCPPLWLHTPSLVKFEGRGGGNRHYPHGRGGQGGGEATAMLLRNPMPLSVNGVERVYGGRVAGGKESRLSHCPCGGFSDTLVRTLPSGLESAPKRTSSPGEGIAALTSIQRRAVVLRSDLPPGPISHALGVGGDVHPYIPMLFRRIVT